MKSARMSVTPDSAKKRVRSWAPMAITKIEAVERSVSFTAAMNTGPDISVALLILGMLLDPIGIMLLTIPILLPVLEAQSINLIWFGVLMAKFLEVGFITPPVGLNVFVVKGIVGDQVPTHQIFKGIGWFVVMDAITITLLIAFPSITLWLPSLIAN